MLRFSIVLVFCVVLAAVGCVFFTDHERVTKDKISHLLEMGDYREAIALIERGPQTPEWRFSLGLLYAYRELDEKEANADFSKAIELIRSAAPSVPQAKEFALVYEQRGSQAFLAFPWAHMIGPFPQRYIVAPK